MTPEERTRTIEFIIESQARLAAAQEQDRQDRVEFQDWAKSLFNQIARSIDRQSELIDHQSRRMDRLDKFYEGWLSQNRDFQGQALRLLHLILDRLPAPPKDIN